MGSGDEVFFINVYIKCDLVSNRGLWKSLIRTKIKLGEGLWCVVRDLI